jgi:hypothetical protein
MDDGLQIFDVSTPAQPTVVGGYDALDGGTGCFVSDNFAYVVGSTESVPPSSGSLQILDITDLARPRWCSSYTTERSVQDIYVSGQMAYLACERSGLHIFDVTTPSQPTLCGSLNTTSGAFGIHVSEPFAYVAGGEGGLLVVDVSDPAHPTQCAIFATRNRTSAVQVAGNLAYITLNSHSTPGTWGLEIVDVTTATAPQRVGFYEHGPYGFFDVHVVGEFAYIAGHLRDGLLIIDVSDPTTPHLCGRYQPLGPYPMRSVQYANGLAFIGAEDDGLLVVDVRDPAKPRFWSQFELSMASVVGLSISGDLVFVPFDREGLWIVRATRPLSAQARWSKYP